MYVILINEDNTLTTTSKQRIMQRSKLVDNLCFLVNPDYNGVDLTGYTVVMEYTLPVSHSYRTEFLTLSKERYKDYLQYVLPVDTDLTSEVGEIEFSITFSKVELDEYGNNIQRVRKIDPGKIYICPTAAWSDIIPDEALSALDQRILKLDAQMQELYELSESILGTDSEGGE